MVISNLKKLIHFHLYSLLGLKLTSAVVASTPIAVTNHSFEQPGTVKQTNWSAVPGWNSDSLATDSGVETGFGATDGTWSGFIRATDSAVWNLTGHTIAAAENFTLTIDAKNNSSATGLRLKLYYDDGGTRTTLATSDVTLTNTMQTFTLQASADDVAASIGKQIGIELDNISAGWAGVDNINLSVSNGPFPYAWYRADVGLSVDGSGNVTSWDTQTTTAHELDNIVGSPRRNIFPTSTGGTTPVVTLDGSSALWADQANWGTVGGDRTVAARVRLQAGNDGFLFDGSTGSGLTRAQVRSGNWQAGVQAAGFNNADPVTTSITQQLWQTHIFQYDENAGSTTVTHWIDGTQVGTHTVAVDTNLRGLIFAANGAASSSLALDVTEFIVYDQLLTNSERAQVESDLTNRFGNLNLPLTFQSATTTQTTETIQPFGTHTVATLEISSTGSNPVNQLTEINYNLNGTTNIPDIEEIFLYDSGSDTSFNANTATLLAQQSAPAGAGTFTINQPLTQPTQHLWIVVKLRGTSANGDIVDAEVTGFTLTGDDAGNYVPTVTAPPESLTVSSSAFFSTIIRSQGDEGVHTYRIPGLATSNAGTLLAVFDIRHDSSVDLHANIDVGLMRSTDGGFTWGPMQTIMDYDASVPNSSGNGVGDPTILVDKNTGRIWCVALWSFGENSLRGSGSGPGLLPTETGQFVINYSDDDGLTWSPPVSITSQIKDPSWNIYFNGPGKGICTREGTLVFPAQYWDGSGVSRSNFIYSTDNGTSWHTAAPAIASGNPRTTEAQIVELDDGSLLLTMRNHAGNGQRLWSIYSWDRDAGETIADGSWGTPWYALRDPVVMASLERYRSQLDGHPFSALLFSNPDNTTRKDMTLYLSLDEGQTWPYKRMIDNRPAAYSCMTILPDGDIGILYETGDTSNIATLTFARFSLDWLVGFTDTDGDGISDFKEDVLGLDRNSSADANQDADGDGSTNAEEVAAQTDINDRTSVLNSTISEAGNSVSVNWPSVPFVRYRLEYSDDLTSDSWTPVSGSESLLGTGSNMQVTIPKQAERERRFYRVVVP